MTETAASSGFVAPGFEPVLDVFEAGFETFDEVGASFAVVHDGALVVDLWGGVVDAETRRPWSRDTIEVVFSGTKGFVAVCVAILIERGLIEPDKPVAHYWPEFAANGKREILVRHVLSHTAGLPGLPEAVSEETARDHRRMAELLAAQAPFWPPGTRLCYHGLTFGWLCAELILRVDGRTVGTFFRDEVAGPLELDLWIGLPEGLESRVATLCRRRDAVVPESRCSEAVTWAILDNPPLFGGSPSVWNSPRWHATENAAGGAIGSARSIARLYGCLACGGSLDGKRILQPETIAAARQCKARGFDECFGWPLASGLGFALQTDDLDFGPPPSAFGHCGAGGSAHGAWPEERVGFSYLMNDLRDDLDRSSALLSALAGVVTAA
jgi:CubicO group peptidase (beta-lactamase class C family)